MKKLLICLAAVALLLSAAAPLSFAADLDSLEIEDLDYYKRFEGQGITLDVYNWGEYISDGSDDSLDVIEAFEELTGIRVRYTTFASNEDLYAKLQSGVSYDILIPSDYMIARMINEGMLQKLDFSNIPNYKYIDDSYKDLECDPYNEYSVPYTWGCVGIIYNTTMTEKEITSWDALWDESYMGNILMFRNSRDAFGIALLKLGYSLNTTDENELAEAAELLKEQKMLVQAHVMDEIFDKMEGGEAIVAPYYNGDAVTMIEDSPDLAIAYPEEGTNFFVDSMVVPANAAHKEAAEMFINFMCEPMVALATAEFIGYCTPNSVAYDMLPDEIKESPVHYPPQEVIDNSEVFSELPEETAEYIDRAWVDVLSYNENPNEWIGPVFLGLTFGASIIILIVRAVKNKKDNYKY